MLTAGSRHIVTGECTVCHRSGLTIASGRLWRHGPKALPCRGSNLPPVPGSLQDRVDDPTGSTGSSQLDDTSLDLFTDATPPTTDRLDLPNSGLPLLKRVPRGARVAASSLLVQLIRAVLSNINDQEAWRRLLGWAPGCFTRPLRGGKSRNLTTLISGQIRSYSAGGVPLQVPPKPSTRLPRAATTKCMNRDEEAAVRASAKLEDGDIKGALRLLGSSDTLAPNDAATLAALQALHPPSPQDRRAPPIPTANPLQVSPAEVRHAITSFPNGSAGGLDGVRPQFLKDLVKGGSTDQDVDPTLEAITELVNIMLAGKVPEFVRPLLFGGSLTALAKKGGGVRPIVVGCVWRRVVAKVVCARLSESCSALLGPRQLGFGIRGGCEGAVHAARRFIENMESDQVFVKIDFRNAFNSVRRDTMLEAVELMAPDVLPFVLAAYGSRSMLRFNTSTIWSEEGIQQGDPLGPLLFCLSIHDLLSSLRSELVLGYLDDISLGGNVDVVSRDFTRLESAQAATGLSLNRLKCEVTSGSATAATIFSQSGIDISQVEIHDLTLLGSPLWPGGRALEAAIEAKRAELQLLSNRLRLMPAHDGLFLLCNIVAVPRLLYLLRSAPCSGSVGLLRYDSDLRLALSYISNADLSDAAWEQASLPVRLGGLGIRSSSLLAPSA